MASVHRSAIQNLSRFGRLKCWTPDRTRIQSPWNGVPRNRAPALPRSG